MATKNYLGNPLLKGINVPFEFTQEHVQNFVKCSNDVSFFIENYVKIVHVDKGLITFKMYDFQKRFLDIISNNRYSIAKMSRQVGKSTIVLSFLLHYSLFNGNKSVAILANKAAIAKELLSRIKRMFENLPEWLQQGVIEWNKGNIEFENGSKIFASATSSNAIRGMSQNCVFLDEFAHISSKLAKEFFASVYPTITSGESTKLIVVSTPNGLNHYFKLWSDAEKHQNSYIPLDVRWDEMPGRDEKWKLDTIKNIGQALFDQEFDCQFIGSSKTLINSKKLQELTIINNPISNKDNLDIYVSPIKNNSYVISVDTSFGVEKDYSAFTVIDISNIPYEVVAKFRDDTISPLLYPDIIEKIGKYYNDAYVIIENNNIGSQICDIMHHDISYENLIFTTSEGRKGTKISGGFSKQSQIGLKMTQPVKRIGCSNLKTLIENNQFIINDPDILIELSNFIKQGNSYSAEEGENDDLVMTLVIFAWLTTQQYFKELTNIDIRHSLMKQKKHNDEQSLTPFGFIDDGLNEEITVDSDGEHWQNSENLSNNW